MQRRKVHLAKVHLAKVHLASAQCYFDLITLSYGSLHINMNVRVHHEHANKLKFASF